MERRLAAILTADVVGYSRLMSKDEAGTLAALKGHRNELINPTVAQHKGRIVKLIGDGALVEFASVVDAVNCAIAIQKAMGARNAGVPEDKRIQFRIGINIGDVIVEGDDIYGDGVNISARLEEVAEPGGICISRKVYEEVTGKTDGHFVDAGDHNVKNIARPVRVWRWSPKATTPVGVPKTRLPLPDKPSIAVLPFNNMSGDAEQEYFADGITEDIITELARFRSLFVIARNSTFAFKGQALDVSDVGRRLGVGYLVEGSVRKSNDRVRVTTQLIETETGAHIWAERYDRHLEDIFAVQDEIVRTIVSTVAGRIDTYRQSRVPLLSQDQLEAYDCFLRGKALFFRVSAPDFAQARGWFERAIEVDPANADAHALLALTYLMDWMAHMVPDRDQVLTKVLALAQRAVALDQASSRAHWALGECFLFMVEYEKARFHLEKAVRLNPNDAEAHGIYAFFLTTVGELDEAIEEFERAMRVDPYDLNWLPWLKGIAHFTSRQYDQAIAALQRVEVELPEIHGWLAASYAMVDRIDEAHRAREAFFRGNEEVMVSFPGRKLAAWESYWKAAIPYRDQSNLDHLYAALRKAGFSD